MTFTEHWLYLGETALSETDLLPLSPFKLLNFLTKMSHNNSNKIVNKPLLRILVGIGTNKKNK